MKKTPINKPRQSVVTESKPSYAAGRPADKGPVFDADPKNFIHSFKQKPKPRGV